MQYRGILLGLVLLFAIPAFSLTEDFSITAPKALNAEQCSPLPTALVITNTGEVASVYQISWKGPSDWVSGSNEPFSLEPGQATQLPIALNVPCDSLGKYKLEGTVATVFGTTADFSLEITVAKPLNVNLVPKTLEQTILPCDTAAYQFGVINTGAFAEEYTVSVDKFSTDTSASEPTFILAPGTLRTVNLAIEPANCRTSGDFTVKATVSASQSKARKDLDLTLHILPTGIPDIAPGISSIRNNYSEALVDFDIKNTGDKDTTYTLGVSGADWISVEPATITIPAGEDKTATLHLEPEAGTKAGSYQLALTATTRGIEYQKTIAVNLKKVSALERLWTNYWWAIILLLLLIIITLIVLARFLAYTRTPEYQARKAQRLKEKEEKRKLKEQKRKEEEAKRKEEKKKKEDEKRKKAEKKQEEKRKKEEEKRRRKAEKEQEKKNSAAEARKAAEKIKAEKQQKKSEKESEPRSWIGLWLIIIGVLIIGLGLLAYLYWQVIQAQWYWIVLLGGTALITAAVLFLIMIWNRRFTRTVKFSLLQPKEECVVRTGWGSGIAEVGLRVKQMVEAGKLSVAQRSQPVFRQPEEMVFKYATISSTTAPNQVEKARIAFSVPRKWMAGNKVNEGSIRLLRWDGDNWRGVGTEIVGSNKTHIHFEAFAPLATVAIVGKSKAENKEKSPWLLYLAIFLILVSIGGIALYYSQSPALRSPTNLSPVGVSAKGIPAQILKEDTSLRVDLKQYFTDPDGDALQFTYTPTEHMVITVKDGTATIVPEKDWHGNTSVQFIAEDGHGGKVKSNKVEIVVLDEPEPTFWDRIGKGVQVYLGYIIGAVIILVAVIIILEFRKQVMQLVQK